VELSGCGVRSLTPRSVAARRGDCLAERGVFFPIINTTPTRPKLMAQPLRSNGLLEGCNSMATDSSR
jgi:hypothetical protein